MGSKRKEYTFFWYIENYSFCWHQNGTSLVSPYFTVGKLLASTWKIQLYPRGDKLSDVGHISLFLFRCKESGGPEKISLNFELSFLAADGSTFVKMEEEHEFVRDRGYGNGCFLKMDEVLLQRKAFYLPKDILTVRCRMWKGEGNVLHIGQSSARTRIRIEKTSFLHKVKNFSTLQPDQKKTIKIRSHSKKKRFISCSLHFIDCLGCEKKIIIEISTSDSRRILRKCELSLLDEAGNVVKCGVTDNICDGQRQGIYAVPLSMTRDAILNSREYLPNDELSLICECTFSSGIESVRIEETLNEITLDVLKKKRKRNPAPDDNDTYMAVNNLTTNCFVPDNTNASRPKKKSTHPGALEDIKSLYMDQCLTDVKLKTKSKSFLAHKIVLCARSPVFKAMLTSDMKEEINDCIHIDDLEDDVVQQLVLFLYSDNLDNLQWRSATELFYAADKYQISKLKEVCSSFLVENLTTTNAGELLLLADTHNDCDLKKLVEDFILEHEEQIFASKEWDLVVEKNSKLAINTMQLKYKRKYVRN